MLIRVDVGQNKKSNWQYLKNKNSVIVLRMFIPLVRFMYNFNFVTDCKMIKRTKKSISYPWSATICLSANRSLNVFFLLPERVESSLFLDFDVKAVLSLGTVLSPAFEKRASNKKNLPFTLQQVG